jgi:chemotaxis protein methyltransferase WspC
VTVSFRVKAFLREAMGLDIESMGAAAIEHALRERMKACGSAGESDYLDLLDASGQEREELIERLVVPETWFFRDEQPFRLLRKYVVEEWQESRSGEPLRSLSMPCSTGEEPYSMAMTLFDSGLEPRRIRIDGCDISRSALAKAKAAVYGKNSFRTGDLSFRERYFDPAPGGCYALKEAVRDLVSFYRENLFDPDFARDKGPYDVIFFRNLMIYLARDLQERALSVMERLLAPSGLLFVGHAETIPSLERWFSSVRYPFAFAYRKRSDERRKAAPGSSAGIRMGELRRSPPANPAPVGRSAACVPVPPPRSPGLLEEARRLADEGRVEEARRLCEAALRARTPQAETYYLLGLLYGAETRDDEAEDCFRKAVYLAPDHHPALRHLALAAERRGDPQAAEVFRQRARKAERQQGGKSA